MTQQYAVLALVMLVSVGLFFAIDAMSPLSPSVLTMGYGAVALNAFTGSRDLCSPVRSRSSPASTRRGCAGVVSITVAVLTLLWIARTRVSQLQFALTTGARTEPVLLGMPKRQNTSAAESAVKVRFEADGKRVAADVGMSVLEIAEKGGQPIEAGCRMGVCGADPIAILDGMSCLSTAEGTN